MCLGAVVPSPVGRFLQVGLVLKLCIWLDRNDAEQHILKAKVQGVKSSDAVVLQHYLSEGQSRTLGWVTARTQGHLCWAPTSLVGAVFPRLLIPS